MKWNSTEQKGQEREKKKSGARSREKKERLRNFVLDDENVVAAVQRGELRNVSSCLRKARARSEGPAKPRWTTQEPKGLRRLSHARVCVFSACWCTSTLL